MNRNLFENPSKTICNKQTPKNVCASRKSFSNESSNRRLSFSSQKKKRQSISSFPNNNNTPQSARDEQLKKYFNTPQTHTNSPYQKMSRSPLSKTPCSLLSRKISQVCIDDVENIPPNLVKQKEMLPCEKLNPVLVEEQISQTPPNSTNCVEVHKNITPKQNPMYDRIRRDLNSPSAGVRIRALKALK